MMLSKRENLYEVHVRYEYLHLCNKEKTPEVLKRFIENNAEKNCVSSITYAEMINGVEKSQAKERNRIAYTLFFCQQLRFWILMLRPL